MNTTKSILVGVDFSSTSATALKQAMRIASWNRASIRVVHVLETLMVVDLQEALSVMQEDIVNAMREDAERGWQEFAAAIPGAAELPFEVEINSTVAALSRRVGEMDAGLLVLGIHGGQKERGVGPVAAACVRRA